MAARYDDVSDTYGVGVDSYDGAAVRALLDLVGPVVNGCALDLACGHGLLARELVRRGARVTGIDLSERLLDRARSIATDDGHVIDYIHGDAADPNILGGAAFELVVCNFGLSDIDDLRGACSTIARLLIPGGRLMFSILHPCFSGAADVSGSWPTDASYHDEGWWRATGKLSTLRQKVGANHRTLSTYFNTLTSHGLVVDAVVEPRPEQAWSSERSGAGQQPVYLVARCRRAGVQ